MKFCDTSIIKTWKKKKKIFFFSRTRVYAVKKKKGFSSLIMINKSRLKYVIRKKKK